MGLGSERDLVPLGAGFDIVKRGYSRTQVEEHLERLDSDLRLIAADRDAAMSQAADIARQMERARSELDELRGQVNRLSLPPTSLEGLSERLQRMLKLAQEEASDTRARAETDAVHIRSRSEADGAALRNRYQNLIAEVDGRRVELETEHRELVEKSQAEFAARTKQADDERIKADADAEARRNQVEEDFEIAMAARRTEAMKALATQEATSKAEAERRVRDATDEADRIRTQVNEEATHLRAQLAEQERSSKAESEKRLRDATEEAARIRAMVAEEQRTSKAEAERRVREATEEANRRTNQAHARVEALRTLRIQIADQLRAATTLINNATPALEPLTEEQAAVRSGLVGSDADHPWPASETRPQSEGRPQDASPRPQEAAPTDAKPPSGPHGQATTTQAIANAPTRRTTPVTQPKPANQQNPAAQPAVPNRPGNNVRRSEPSTKR